MKRLFLVIFGISALIVTILVFHREILTTITFMYSRPHRALSDKDLDERIAQTDAGIAVFNEGLGSLPGNPADRSLDDHANARGLKEQRKEALAERSELMAEKAFRTRKSDYLLLAGLVVSAVVFLESTRRMLRDRDPRARKRAIFREGLTKEIADERLAKSAKAAARRLESMGAVDPRLSRLKPGISSRQEVINALGQPHERTVFLEFEAWIYYLPRSGNAAPLEEEAAEDDVWSSDTKPSPRDRKDHTPVTVLFSGNLVHDLSIGTIRNQKDMRRIL
jgi:hypothetical protein